MQHRGTLKFYHADRQFGFITPDSPNMAEVFVGSRGLGCDPSELTRGCRVQFDLDTSDSRGPRAMNLKLETPDQPADDDSEE